MSVAQQSFAEAMQHRLRSMWPKATVEYTGGGWFTYRAEPTLLAWKMRRKELSREADKVLSVIERRSAIAS
jgi:hypothetical protein